MGHDFDVSHFRLESCTASRIVKKPRRNNEEFKMQVALFKWARVAVRNYPGLDLLSSSLNGVWLTDAQAAKAKAAGMLAGEHDVKLPVPRGGYVGLSIELKYGKNKPTKEQNWYGDRLTEEGWLVGYCWDWLKAANLIVAYLSGKKRKP